MSVHFVIADDLTHVGNRRIRFCSSLSSTSNVRYLNLSSNRGRTENASFTSRMQTLLTLNCLRSQHPRNTYMCVMRRDVSVSRDLDTWSGPRRSPGRISWHSRRISYLSKSASNLSNVDGDRLYLHSKFPGPSISLNCPSVCIAYREEQRDVNNKEACVTPRR